MISFSNSSTEKSPPATIIKLFKDKVFETNFSISFNSILEIDSIVPEAGLSRAVSLKSIAFSWFCDT